MIPLVVLLFVAAPLTLTMSRRARQLSPNQRKAIQACLYVAMLLSAGVGMALDPRQDDRIARTPTAFALHAAHL